MPPKPNRALKAVRAVEAKRKPARRGGSRPSGGSPGGWETVEEYGDWRLPILRPTRPCPQCGAEATPERLRDNALGLYWLCSAGHSFAVGPSDARMASCIEAVEIVTARGAKRSTRCTSSLQGLGAFLVCPRHQTAVWPWALDVSPIALCQAGVQVAEHIARVEADLEDPLALRPGEVPFGFSDEEWVKVQGFAGPEPDAVPAVSVEPLVDPGAGSAATPSPGAVTPVEDDERMAASLAPPAPDDTGRLFAVAEIPVEAKRKDVNALSPSSASVLAQCPRRFEQSKVLGRKEPVGRAASLGKFVHKVLELLTAKPLEGRTEAAAKEVAGRLWRDVDRHPDDPVDYLEADEGDVRELRRDRVELAREVSDIAGWVRQFKGESWAALAYAVSIEASYGGTVAYREMNLWDTTVAGVPFRGYADRIDRHHSPTRNGLIVVDYKSGRAPTDRRTGKIDPRKLAEKGEQLLLYAGPVEQKVKETTGEKVVGALLAYIGAGAQVVLWVDDERRAEAETKLARLWRDLGRYETAARADGTPYPANVGYLCGWCPFFEDCREGSEWLLSEFAATWMKKREAKGEPPVQAMVEVQSWTRERRQRWWEMARA